MSPDCLEVGNDCNNEPCATRHLVLCVNHGSFDINENEVTLALGRLGLVAERDNLNADLGQFEWFVVLGYGLHVACKVLSIEKDSGEDNSEKWAIKFRIDQDQIHQLIYLQKGRLDGQACVSNSAMPASNRPDMRVLLNQVSQSGSVERYLLLDSLVYRADRLNDDFNIESGFIVPVVCCGVSKLKELSKSGDVDLAMKVGELQ